MDGGSKDGSAFIIVSLSRVSRNAVYFNILDPTQLSRIVKRLYLSSDDGRRNIGFGNCLLGPNMKHQRYKGWHLFTLPCRLYENQHFHF